MYSRIYHVLSLNPSRLENRNNLLYDSDTIMTDSEDTDTVIEPLASKKKIGIKSLRCNTMRLNRVDNLRIFVQ